jgi:hypothetical protein
MPSVSAFHSSKDKSKYHNNSKCGPGSEIPPHNKVMGAVGSLCADCAKLNAQGK